MDTADSPFRPDQSVSPAHFTGRKKELTQLTDLARRATKHKILSMSFVSGERGVGKSTLVANVRDVLESEHGIIGAHVNLSGVKTVEDAVATIYEGIVKDNFNRQWWKKIRGAFGDVSNVSFSLFGGGVNFNFPTERRKQAVAGFADDLRELIQKMGRGCKGLFLALDDINGLAANPDFANWLKGLIDSEATNRRALPVAIVLAGLAERRQEMIDNNESVNRIFLELVDLQPWSLEETVDFFRRSFKQAGAVVEEKGIKYIAQSVGGLPVLAHEVGHAVWQTADTTNIKFNDMFAGLLSAADVVGKKWLNKNVIDALKSEKYLSVLSDITIMGDIMENTPLSRQEMLREIPHIDVPNLDNFLNRMKKLGALIPAPNQPGVYHFPNLLYRFCFLLSSLQRQSERKK